MIEQTASRPLVMSLPNVLTYARIAAVPVMAVCLYAFDSTFARWMAMALFAAACLSDFLDGYLARAWQQQSSLGRMLDPIADKLLVGAALLMLVHLQTVDGLSLFAALIILSREILVSGLREFLAELKVSLPVSQAAKWKTGAQMIAIGLLIAGPAGDTLIKGWTSAGLIMLWLSAGLTLWTGYDYLKAGIRHAMEPGQT
ncbi:MAG: CDP-diacylglycerol--glycerol-3-phosphate 3-phosphatidyltransferase [Pseudomonadota bacterium]